jgi:hypothetical protein
MAPAHRLRSLLAWLLRRFADAAQPPAPAPAAPAPADGVPAAGAGNEHWLAVVRARAPELLTDGGIHAGGCTPAPPAVFPPRESTLRLAAPRFDADPEAIQHRRPQPRRLNASRFTSAAVRAFRRREFLPLEDDPLAGRREPAVFDQPPTGKPTTATPTTLEPPTGESPTGGQLPRRESAQGRRLVWPDLPRSQPASAPRFDDRKPAERAAAAEFPPAAARATKAARSQPAFVDQASPPTANWPAPTADSPSWNADTLEDPWPQLPDNEPLWLPPVSAFDADEVRRLDDEQRGW